MSPGAGIAERGAGAPLAGCERGADHERVAADPLRVFGVRSQRAPLPPCNAPRFTGCDQGECGRPPTLWRGNRHLGSEAGV